MGRVCNLMETKMTDTNESNVKTVNICHACCNPLEQREGNVKYRRASEIDNDYPGTLFAVRYFWCELCPKAYMSPEQCDRDSTREKARNGQLIFILAPVQVPSIKVHIVDWLKE
jgi:hypothetical protein